MDIILDFLRFLYTGNVGPYAMFFMFVATVMLVSGLMLWLLGGKDIVQRRLSEIAGEHDESKKNEVRREGAFNIRWTQPIAKAVLPREDWKRSRLKSRLVRAGYRQEKALHIFLASKVMQVYMGQAGLFQVWDPEEELAVPGASTGANDLPVSIQDRTFDSNNQFLYQPNNMWGMLGDHILVNGAPNAVFSLEPRAYRLRFLNGSNARTYKLGWSNNMAMKVIGSDGGLLPAALSRPYVMLMPGERVDVWADFTQYARKQLILRSLSFDPVMGMGGGGGGMGGGGMGGGGRGGGGGHAEKSTHRCARRSAPYHLPGDREAEDISDGLRPG